MEGALEEGRAPLALSEGGARREVVAEVERQTLGRWCISSVAYVVVDVILSIVFFLMPFNFNVHDAAKSQVNHFDFSTSIFDWVIVALVRDVVFATLVAFTHWKAPCKWAASWARRVAVVFLLASLYRLSFLDFFTVTDAEKIFTPTLVWALVSSFCSFWLGHKLVRSTKRLQKVLEENTPEEQAAAAEAQYSSALTLLQTLRVLKPYFWPSTGTWREVTMNRVRASLTWVFVALSKVCTLISPMFLAKATNEISDLLRGEKHEVTSEITKNLVFYALMIFFGRALKEAQSLVYIRVQQAAYIEIADTTFAHLHSLSVDWHVRKKGGNVIRSIDRGVAAAQNTMQYCFLNLVPTLGEAVAVTLIFIFRFKNLRLAVFVGLNLYLYAYSTIKVTLWRKRFREATMKQDNESHDRLADSLVNYETVKYFTAEEYERTEYRSVVQKFQKYSMATQRSLSLLNILQQLIVNFALGGGLVLSAQALVEGEGKELGDFVAVNVYILNVFTPLNFLGTIYNMVVNALVEMKNFGQLLAEPSDIKDEPHAPAADMHPKPGVPIVEFKNVCFQYEKQVSARAIKDISFKVEAGKKLALVGTSGAGKTTITRLLFRFYDVSSGQVMLNGQDVRKITQKSLREAIGMVPQDTVMFNASIAHNIRYGLISSGREITMEEVEKAAKSAQLDTFVDQQAQRYETVVGERGLKLSGGEKQRLAIARCFLKDPPIVVLDEATSALDSATEQKVQESLDGLSRQRTVIAIAHRLSTVRNFNEIIVLEQGEIIERGTHSELMAMPQSKYALMWRRQAEGIFDDPSPAHDAQASGAPMSNGGGLGLGESQANGSTGHGHGHESAHGGSPAGGHGGGHGSGSGSGHGGHGGHGGGHGAH
mmetsp:Transcript_16120/g.34837  ORF Transcript_16120/g.34837 Transcript_16120/m.34837 type:complete len:879 (-) Transcript_16120:38-2674(-)